MGILKEWKYTEHIILGNKMNAEKDIQCDKNSDYNPPIKSHLILMHLLKLLHNEEVFQLQDELNREIYFKEFIMTLNLCLR